MAQDKNPLSAELDIETKRQLLNEMDYGNMHGTRPTVTFPGSGLEVKVPHGFAFTPTPEGLTVRPHLAYADTGAIYMTRNPDDKYVYLAAPRAGKVIIEIAHPNKTG